MASIDLAYSLELGEVVDAMEANELWIEGILTNKWAFECADENCNAKITCKNMDTYADERKVKPHFIMSSRENMHSSCCKVYNEYTERQNSRGTKADQNITQNTSKTVCFHIERPINHRIINNIAFNNKKNDNIDNKETKKVSSASRQKRHSNYYWLTSLIWYYIDSYKKGKTDRDIVKIDFGNNKIYPYTLNRLFKRIKLESEITDKDKNYYIYYGRGKIFSRKDGGYDLVFSEKFYNSKMRVKCVINKVMIDTCQYGKSNKINILEIGKGKETFIYILASKKYDIKSKTVFLNTKNLDCISISKVDLDQLDEPESSKCPVLT